MRIEKVWRTGPRFLHYALMKQRKFVLVIFMVASLLMLAACGGAEKKEDETWLGASTDTAATATHPASPGGTAVVPDVDAGTTMIVVLEDGSIAVPQDAIPPGPAVLTIENRGTDLHNLFIEGEGINRAAGDSIGAGGSASLDVVFKPGTYTLYCPVLDHRDKGEEVQITIEQP